MTRGRTFEFLCVAGIAVCAISGSAYFHSLTSDRTHLNVFQARDISRAALWWRGHPVFHGPEFSGTGQIRGPFYYWSVSLPLLFGGSWKELIYLSHGLSTL